MKTTPYRSFDYVLTPLRMTFVGSLIALALLGAGCSSSVVTSAGSPNAGFTISSSNPTMMGGAQGISVQGSGLFPTLEVSK